MSFQQQQQRQQYQQQYSQEPLKNYGNQNYQQQNHHHPLRYDASYRQDNPSNRSSYNGGNRFRNDHSPDSYISSHLDSSKYDQESRSSPGGIRYTYGNVNNYSDASPASNDNVKKQENEYLPSDFSEKNRAQIQREKSALEDNMKDFTYMQMISGTTKQINKKHQVPNDKSDGENQFRNKPYAKKDRSPVNNMYQQQRAGNFPQNEKSVQQQYYDLMDRSPMGDRFTLNELKSGNTPGSIEKNNKKGEAYLNFQNNEGRSPSPIKYDQRQNTELGLTPKVAKHFDGVQNLYRQELEILKHNIYQCQQQDSKIIHKMNEKENKLWRSFSRSHSPQQRQQEDDENSEYYEQNNDQPIDEGYYDPSPTRLQEVNKPENILKNEIYMMMLKTPQQNQNSQINHSNMNESSGILTYSKYPGEFSQASNGGANFMLKSSIGQSTNQKQRETPHLIQPYQRQPEVVIERDSMIEQSNILSGHNGSLPIEDEIDKLKRENDSLRQNLNNLISETSQRSQNNNNNNFQIQQQQVKGVSFKDQKEKSSICYYDKNSPSIATNPYQRNLYNSAQKGSNIMTMEDHAIMSDQSNLNNQAHNLTLSPITGLHNSGVSQPLYKNPRDQHYSEIINVDQTQLSQYIKQQEEENFALRMQQEHSSPYKELSYLDQVKKLREERENDEEMMQKAEMKRKQFQRNVLRNNNGKGNSDNGKQRSNRHDNQKNSTKQIQNAQAKGQQESKLSVNQYLTPNRHQRLQSYGSRRSSRSAKSNGSYLDVVSYSQHLNKNYVIDYKNYVRRVSKYDIDRQTVDIQRLKLEKNKDRKDNVKIKKEEYEQDIIAKKQEEIDHKNQKIQQLQVIKEKQERERREFIRKQQEMFRRAIEERIQVDKSNQYLSPNMVPQRSASKSLHNTSAIKKASQRATPVKQFNIPTEQSQSSQKVRINTQNLNKAERLNSGGNYYINGNYNVSNLGAENNGGNNSNGGGGWVNEFIISPPSQYASVRGVTPGSGYDQLRGNSSKNAIGNRSQRLAGGQSQGLNTHYQLQQQLQQQQQQLQ